MDFFKILCSFLLAITLSLSSASAQNISAAYNVDSLLRVANNMIDVNPEGARKVLDKALSLAEAADLQKSVANVLNYKGISYYSAGQYDEAIKYFQQSLKVLFRIGDKEKIANMMKKIGLAYLNQRNYNKSIEYYSFAQKIFEQLKYIDRKAETHVEMGIIYRLSERYAASVKEFDAALQLYVQLDNKAGQASVFHHLAVSYHELGNYKFAQDNFKKAIYIYENYLDYSGLSNVLNDYAKTLIDLKDYHKALETLETAKNKTSDKYSYLYASILANYGTVLVYGGDYKLAEIQLNNALNIADSLDVKDIQAQVYRSLYELFFRNNDTRSALNYYQKYIAVKDTTSIASVEKLPKVDDNQNLNNLIVLITIFGFVVIAGLVIWLVTVIKQRDRALEELRKLKEK